MCNNIVVAHILKRLLRDFGGYHIAVLVLTSPQGVIFAFTWYFHAAK